MLTLCTKLLYIIIFSLFLMNIRYKESKAGLALALI